MPKNPQVYAGRYGNPWISNFKSLDLRGPVRKSVNGKFEIHQFTVAGGELGGVTIANPPTSAD